MKTTLTASLTWYPLETHVGQKHFKRCMIHNQSGNTITITQRGGTGGTPAVPNVAGDNMGFPIAAGDKVIIPTQEKLYAACPGAAAQVLHYEYFA